MEPIKIDKKTEFDVLYSDGTSHRVKEGILVGVDGSEVVFHNGTDRLSMVFASIETLLCVVELLGVMPLLVDYLLESPARPWVAEQRRSISADMKACFRLGQKDMQAAAVDALLAAADGTQGTVCATLIDAAERIRKLEVME